MSTENTIVPVRKITTGVFGKVKEQAERKEKVMPLLKIVGIVDSFVEEATQFGEYYRLYGDFLAIDGMGKQSPVRSDCAILPNFLAKKLIAAIADKVTGEMLRVEFKLDIGTRPNDASVTGYEFTAEPLDRPQPHEDRLLTMAGPLMKQLEAPTAPAAEKKTRSV